MEILKILGGQPVPIEKQPLNLMEQMIQLCQVLPANLRQEIHKQHIYSMTQSCSIYFLAHGRGIDVDSALLRADAQLLHLPAIQYANDRVEPTQDNTCELFVVEKRGKSGMAYRLFVNFQYVSKRFHFFKRPKRSLCQTLIQN
jgi:hypothetical protein